MDQFFQLVGILTSIFVGLWFILRLIFGEKWKRKVTTTLFLGQGLLNASKKLANELPSNVKKETLAEVVTYAFWRFTRLGIVGIMIAIFPIWLLMNQNQLLEKQNEKFDIQNERINLQNNLIEAGRRGSLIILMSNILDQMNEEINEQKKGTDFVDSLGYALSDPLIGRVAALSQGFLPYRYLENDTLTERVNSPERGQLLLSLVKSRLNPITYNKIYQATNFNYADLNGADLSRADLGGADLGGADLGGADLGGADLSGADLGGADLSGADLSGADLSKAYFRGADLSKAYFRGVDLSEANLSWANLSWANLSEARNLRVDQLKEAKVLFECQNLDPELKEQLEKEKPCLFTEEGCE